MLIEEVTVTLVPAAVIPPALLIVVTVDGLPVL
jgi:hypothetical protein